MCRDAPACLTKKGGARNVEDSGSSASAVILHGLMCVPLRSPNNRSDRFHPWSAQDADQFNLFKRAMLRTVKFHRRNRRQYEIPDHDRGTYVIDRRRASGQFFRTDGRTRSATRADTLVAV